jgi:hypothetical protein
MAVAMALSVSDKTQQEASKESPPWFVPKRQSSLDVAADQNREIVLERHPALAGGPGGQLIDVRGSLNSTWTNSSLSLSIPSGQSIRLKILHR